MDNSWGKAAHTALPPDSPNADQAPTDTPTPSPAAKPMPHEDPTVLLLAATQCSGKPGIDDRPGPAWHTTCIATNVASSSVVLQELCPHFSSAKKE